MRLDEKGLPCVREGDVQIVGMLIPAILSHQPNYFSVLEVFVRLEQVGGGNRHDALVFS